jgi:tight adherence protein B
MGPLQLLFLFVATFAVVVFVLLLSFVRMQKSVPAEEFGLASALLREENHSSFRFLNAALSKLDVASRLQRMLDEAALNWSVGRLVTLMLLVTALVVAMTMKLMLGVVGLVLAGLLGISLPLFYVSKRRSKRLKQFEEQFPDALDSLANALRAGLPVTAAIKNLSVEIPAPLGIEFRKITDALRLGGSWESAIQGFTDRIPLIESTLFVSAVDANQKMGGNLGEILVRLSETMRESQALRGEIRALSAHGRLTGIVLTFLPLVIAGILEFVQPGYFDPLLDHRNGGMLIAACLSMLVLAHFVIQWLVDVEG